MEPGPFNLGRWSTPIGAIAVAWVTFVTVMLLFPPGQAATAGTMSELIFQHKFELLSPTPQSDYAVLLVGAIFLFATISWVTSAHKWFNGPVRNVEDSAEKRST